MCDGKEGFTRDGITYSCCYDHYFSRSTCVQCLAGFYGNDCLKKCDNGFYGEWCSNKCNCNTGQFCHHITGCIIEYSGSTEISHRKLNKSSRTDHSLARSNSPVLSLTSTSPTTDIQFPHQTNIFIFAIGSVIALFLGIVIVQFCIKIRINRRKYTQQMSVKWKPVKEEKTYNKINESIIGIEEDSLNEQRHFGRYFELQNEINSLAYHMIR